MKLERVQFDFIVFDPMSKGAENKKSYFTNDKYDIDFDPQNGFVSVASGEARVIVPFAKVKECRTPSAKTDPDKQVVKTKAVQVGEGTFSIVPAAPAAVDVAAGVTCPTRRP